MDRSLKNKPQMPLLLITLTVMSLLWLNVDTRSTIRPWPFESENARTSFYSTATNISSVLNDFSSAGETGWPQRFMMQRNVFTNVWNGPIDPANVNQTNIQNPVLWFDALGMAIDLIFALILIIGVHFTFRNLPNARLSFDLKMMFATTAVLAVFVSLPIWRDNSVTLPQFFALGYVRIMVVAVVGFFCSNLIRFGVRQLRRNPANSNKSLVPHA